MELELGVAGGPHLLDSVLDGVERIARAEDLAEAALAQPLPLDKLLRVA